MRSIVHLGVHFVVFPRHLAFKPPQNQFNANPYSELTVGE